MTLKVAIIAGEASGDQLGAGMAAEIRRQSGGDVSFVGVGGPALEAEGLQSLFDIDDIAIMGISAVIARLPLLVRRINETARALIEARPDVLVIVDSPGFTHRVAKKVRKALPDLPVVQYVCPTVWAWKDYRAAKMTAYVDHVLAILPFEPDVMQRLGGPPTTYVGHRLRTLPAMAEARAQQAARSRDGSERTIVLLPGSRRTEVDRLLPVFGETALLLSRRGSYRFIIPAVPSQARGIGDAVGAWAVPVEVVTGEAEKWKALAGADAALAAAGTVLFELALVGIPTIAGYKTDFFIRLVLNRIRTWSAVLPNLVAGYPVFPEFYDEFLRPEMLARMLDRMSSDTPQRAAVIAGCADVHEKTATDRPANVVAAEIALRYAQGKSPA
ncbi:MAG: lipid-A-disaccharide synthase [Rhizobium sp.]|nr:lipid-A-disaccharide synthase [Rhizobium sp.]